MDISSGSEFCEKLMLLVFVYIGNGKNIGFIKCDPADKNRSLFIYNKINESYQLF